jgi:hypothetical protein
MYIKRSVAIDGTLKNQQIKFYFRKDSAVGWTPMG